MMEPTKFPFEDHLMESQGEQIIWIKNRAFVIRPATEDDIERVGRGYFWLDDSRDTEEDVKSTPRKVPAGTA